MVRPITRYEDSDEEEGQGEPDKENDAKKANSNAKKGPGETVEEAMEKMFQEDEKEKAEKEDTKENDDNGEGNKVFPIFRKSSARTGLRGSPAKSGSTPNKGWLHKSRLPCLKIILLLCSTFDRILIFSKVIN